MVSSGPNNRTEKEKEGVDVPAVFIHGVPDTEALWDPLFAHLGSKGVVALSLPGFGVPVPPGFHSSKEEYVAWIIEQLDALDSQVDLVGHDWGCILAMRVASIRPDLVRSVAGGSGPLSTHYEWHALAKIWQIPVEGERFMASLTAQGLSQVLESLGVKQDYANATAARVDDAMKSSILQLYRSAIEVGAEWQPDLHRVTSPAMVFWGAKDEECPVAFAKALYDDVRAKELPHFDCGHWIPLEKPKELAQSLLCFWSSNT